MPYDKYRSELSPSRTETRRNKLSLRLGYNQPAREWTTSFRQWGDDEANAFVKVLLRRQLDRSYLSRIQLACFRNVEHPNLRPSIEQEIRQISRADASQQLATILLFAHPEQ